jgi:uncharacterized damage-inducible protein DinB
MKSRVAIVCVGILVAAAALQAQTKPAANPISGAIKAGWDGAKRNIVESAEQMTEANYAYKPTDSVRSFGQILAHVAGASYVFCSAAKGEKTPFSEEHFEKTATTRAAIIKAVQDSNAYCDAVIASLTDAKAAESIALPFGMGNAPRAQALIFNSGHLMEHYGNLVTYFRMKGMVPPSSKRQ